MQLTRALAVVCLVVVAACSQPTPYQQRQDGYGFNTVQLEPNRYRVSFYGNTSTSRETVETYLLYRAAEVTLQVGGDHFQVVERETQRDVSTYSNPGPYYGSSLFYGYRSYPGSYYRPYSGSSYGATFGVGTTRTTEKFEATVEFLAFRGPKPPDDPMSYDARDVVANLGPLIHYPTP
jgi:hypothetical protein